MLGYNISVSMNECERFEFKSKDRLTVLFLSINKLFKYKNSLLSNFIIMHHARQLVNECEWIWDDISIERLVDERTNIHSNATVVVAFELGGIGREGISESHPAAP